MDSTLEVVLLPVSDIDEKARELGIELDRVEMPNADPAFVAILARLVARALAQQPAPA